MSIKNIIVVSGVAAAITLASLGAAEASETMKPLQGVSFHAGTKHAVGYFLTESGSCRLVLTRPKMRTSRQRGLRWRLRMANSRSISSPKAGPSIRLPGRWTAAQRQLSRDHGGQLTSCSTKKRAVDRPLR